MQTWQRFSRRSILAGMASLGVGSATLAACGQVPAAPAEAPEAKEAPQAEPTAAPEAMEPNVIKYMHYTTQQQVWDDTYGAVISRYEERNPDVKVELDLISGALTNMAEKAVSAHAAGIPYDMYYGWFGYISQFATAEIIQPLDALVSKDAAFDLSEYYDFALERVNGRLYGIAWFMGARTIWYNADLMTNAGVDSPSKLDAEGKFTWDALAELSTKLTTHEGANVSQWRPLHNPCVAFGAGFWVGKDSLWSLRAA